MKNKIETIILGIMTIIGIGMIILGVYFLKSYKDFKEQAAETTGHISEIYVTRDAHGDLNYKVSIKYNVLGEEYEGILNSYNATMYVGKEEKIFYDREKPGIFKSESDGNSSYIVVAIGALFSLIGIIPFILKQSRNKKNKFLIENGNKIYVKFKRVEINTSYVVNGRSPYRIICEGTDGDYNEYISQNIWKNPERFISDRNISDFAVYIDPNNNKKYYMPLDEIEEFIK